MADTNFKGAFWGSEVRKRQARSYWPTEADNTDGVDMSSANTVLLLNGEGTNGAQNNTFLDSSTNSFTITRNGDATQGSLSPFSPTGWSAYFDGTTDGISTASTSAVAFGATANNYTVEFWLYPIVHDVDYDLYLTTGNMNIGYYPGVGYGMTVSINDGSAYPGTYKITGGTAPTLHKWNHIAACRSGGTLRLFVNGVQTGNTHNDTFTHVNNTIRVSYSEASYSPQCYISNVRIVKGHALYTGNFTPPRLLPLTPYGSNVQYPATANVSSSFTAGNVSFLSLRGPQFVDDSPSRLPITIAGDSKIVPFSPYRNYLDIPRSYSSYFDGSGDYLTVAANAAFNVGAASNNFTMECWVYQTANSGTRGLFGPRPSTNSGFDGGYGFYIQDGVPTFQVFTFGAFAADTATGPTIPLNTWAHIAGVRNNSQIRVYVNGVGGTAVSTTRNSDNSSPFYIGSYEGSNYLFTGYISDVRLVKGTAVYTGNFTSPSAPLLTSGNSIIYASVANVNTTFASANTSLLTLQDANIFDRSSNAFAITAFGNVQPTIQNPFGETITSNVVYDATVYDGSGYFNGTTSTRLTLASNTAFAFGTGAYTIQAWVYLTAYGSPATNLIDCGGATNSIGLSILSSGGLFINKYGTGSVFSTSSAVPLNSWTHVAASRVSTGSNDTRLFINGVLAATGTDNNDWTVTTTPSIGGINISGYTVSGYLSDVRIAKGTALYTSSFVPPNSPSSAVANTSLLLKFQNAGVVDRTGKADIITLGNGQISTSVYKYGSGSIYFDGNGDGLFLPSSPNYGLGSGDFTVEFWAYFNSTAAGSVLIRAYGTTADAEWTIYTGTNTLIYYISSDGSTWNVANGVNIGSISTSTWYHVALVRSGTTIKPYLNGVAGTATTTSATIFNPLPTLWIGSGFNASGEFFNGYLDDVRITKGQARYDVSQSTITIPRRTFNLF